MVVTALLFIETAMVQTLFTVF